LRFEGERDKIYMDDIVIHSSTIEEHCVLLQEVYRRLKENNMKLNPNKIQFCKKEAKLLRVTLNAVDVIPSEIKKNEALKFSTPKSVTKSRRFLSLTG